MATTQQAPPTGTINDQLADPYKAKNSENELPVKDKMESLLAFIDRCRYAMMTTRDPDSGRLASRCMELAGKESNGTELLFFTNTHTHKVDELAHDPHVNLAFVNAAGDWASIAGSASVVGNRGLVEAHYTPTLRARLGDLGDGKHDGSAGDPRLGMIRVHVETATCSLSGKGILGAVKDVVTGAVSGKVAEVAKLREISAKEVDLYRTANMA